MKNKKIKWILRNSPLRNMWLYHRLRYALKEQYIRRCVAKKGDDYEAIKHDLIDAITKYHWNVDEFYMYRYMELTPEQRSTFVPEYEKNVFCDKVNDFEASKVFDSKWETYQVFKDYYKRDCCTFEKEDLKSNGSPIDSFLNRHKDFIFKPDSNASGRGVSIIHAQDRVDAINRVYKAIGSRKGRFVLEELIEQSAEMACFHPLSVNTVRIRTFRFDDRIEILPSNMRIGRGESVVDNTGKGGISASLNDDGVVIVACDEAGVYFEKHPDTGIPIVGFQVPQWKELIALASSLCTALPKVRYVGWDFALTNSGWVLVEGNDKGMFVGIQKPLQKGFRPYLNKILSELSIEL